MSTSILSLLGLILSLVETVAPQSGNIAKIVQTLEGLLSVGSGLITQLVEPVKNIIAALRAKDGVTPEQNAALDALEAQWDAAFDQATASEGVGSNEPEANTTE